MNAWRGSARESPSLIRQHAPRLARHYNLAMPSEHDRRILDQFTRQAAPFAAAPEIRNPDVLARIIEFAGTAPGDTVLDVACGPGLLACAFAHIARHVTGIDLTPKMLEQARAQQRAQGLENLSWYEGDVRHLPFEDGSFSVVSTRFTFHHFEEPLAVLKEMRRVCRVGGTVLVADSAPGEATVEAFNAMERLRDPSHVRALPPEELIALFPAAGLSEPRARLDLLPYELESFLARSFPPAGNAERIRQLFEESLTTNRLGLGPVKQDGVIRFQWPLLLVAASVAP